VRSDLAQTGRGEPLAAEEPLAAVLERVLRDLPAAHAGGVREHDLLALLARRGVRGFLPERGAGLLDLYRRHFRLFHHLYGLRRALRRRREADLEIHCLGIRWLPYRNPDTRLPAAEDPVEAWYADLSRLDRTGPDEVEEILAGGWRLLRARLARERALAALGLEDPVDDAAIRRRWHALALRHHPDRGGSAVRFRELSAAVAALRAA